MPNVSNSKIKAERKSAKRSLSSCTDFVEVYLFFSLQMLLDVSQSIEWIK